MGFAVTVIDTLRHDPVGASRNAESRTVEALAGSDSAMLYRRRLHEARPGVRAGRDPCVRAQCVVSL